MSHSNHHHHAKSNRNNNYASQTGEVKFLGLSLIILVITILRRGNGRKASGELPFSLLIPIRCSIAFLLFLVDENYLPSKIMIIGYCIYTQQEKNSSVIHVFITAMT